MDIHAFVKTRGLTMAAFAGSASMRATELSQLATGSRYGRLDHHIRLYLASDGAITPTDLMLAHPAFEAAKAAKKPGQSAGRLASGRASTSSRSSRKPAKK